MKRVFFLFTILLLSSTQILAQCDLSETFIRTFGGSGTDKGHSVIITKDSGYAVVGLTTSFGAGNFDIFLAKFDSNGNFQWAKSYGGIGEEYGQSVRVEQSKDSGFVIVGTTRSFGGTDYDAYVIKTDASGNEVWSKYLGGSADDLMREVVQLDNGNFILCGSFYSNSFGQADIGVVCVDKYGSTQWTKRFGGTDRDHVSGITVYDDKIVLICHGLFSFSTAGAGGLIILDTLGNLKLEKLYDTNIRGGLINGMVTSDKFIVAAGLYDAPATKDIFVTKTDTNGNVIWAKAYGGSGYDRGVSVMEVDNGNYIVSGFTESYGSGSRDIILLELDPGGNVVASKTIGNTYYETVDDWSESITVTTNGELVFTGHTNEFGNEDLILGKIRLCDTTDCYSKTVTISEQTLALSASSLNTSKGVTNPLVNINSITNSFVFSKDSVQCSPVVIPCSLSSGFSISDSVVCRGDSVHFTNMSSQNASDLTWYIGSDVFSTDENPALLLDSAGKYQIVLIVADSNCSDTSQHTLQIVDNIYWEHPDYEICPFDTVVVSDADDLYAQHDYTSMSGSVTYPFPLFSSVADTTYLVEVTKNNAGSCYWTDTDTFTITVFSEPVSNITVSNDQQGNYVFNGCCGATFLWSAGGLFSDSTAQITNANLQESTWIYLEVKDSNNCVSRDSVFVNIDLYIPNIITPNDDKVNDVFVVRGLNVKNLTVYNRWGRLVFSVADYQNDWDGGSVADGMYFYYIVTENTTYKGWLEVKR